MNGKSGSISMGWAAFGKSSDTLTVQHPLSVKKRVFNQSVLVVTINEQELGISLNDLKINIDWHNGPCNAEI